MFNKSFVIGFDNFVMVNKRKWKFLESIEIFCCCGMVVEVCEDDIVFFFKSCKFSCGDVWDVVCYI